MDTAGTSIPQPGSPAPIDKSRATGLFFLQRRELKVEIFESIDFRQTFVIVGFGILYFSLLCVYVNSRIRKHENNKRGVT